MFPNEMERLTSHVWRLAALAGTALGLMGCSPEPAPGQFKETGRLVALSGGDAGAGGACHVCHGMKGEGDGNLVPRIAGLNRGYFARQLDYFADGQRQHPQMSWIARQLGNDDRLRVADYYAAMDWQPAEAEAAAASADCLPAAQRLYQHGAPARGLGACANCHGREGEGYGAGNPALAGQPAPYIAEQLRQWRSGKRYGDPLGVMRRAALALTEEEITALGDYVSLLGREAQSPVSRAECPPPRRRDPRSGA